MKKLTPKLVIRCDTVRALTVAEFTRVVGGDSGAVCTAGGVAQPPGTPKG